MSSIGQHLIESSSPNLKFEKTSFESVDNQLVKTNNTARQILSGSSDSDSNITASTNTPPVSPALIRASKKKIQSAVSQVGIALEKLIEAAKNNIEEKKEVTIYRTQLSSTSIEDKKQAELKSKALDIFKKVDQYYGKYFDRLSSDSWLSKKQIIQVILTAFSTPLHIGKSHAYYLGFKQQSINKENIDSFVDLDKRVLIRQKKSGKIRFYTTINHLGTGTFGIVNQVLKFHSSRTAALKLNRVNKQSLSEECAFFKKLKIKLNGRILTGMQESPKAIKIFDEKSEKSEVFGLLYSVYNLGSLDRAINQFSLKEKLMIFRQLVEFFTEIKELGISHGDIKPANVLVHRDQEGVKAALADWGGAQFKEDITDLQYHTKHYTLQKDFLERVETADLDEIYNICHLHDVFSMGCTFFHLFTGKEIASLKGCEEKFFAISFENIDDLSDDSGQNIETILKLKKTPPSIIRLIKTMLQPNRDARQMWKQNAHAVLTAFPIVFG